MTPAALPSTLTGEMHWRQGLRLAGGQHWPEAARAFARAARAVPMDRVYWLNLANAQRRRGAPARAVAAARRCLRVAPGDPVALRLEAECLASMHRHAEAVAVFARLEAAGQADGESMVKQAQSLLALLRPQAAASVLLRALSRQPTLVPAYLMLSEACRDQGLKREAVECMKTVLALEPSNVHALSHLCYEKRQLFDWTDLESDMQRMASHPEQMQVFGLLSLPLAPELLLSSARAVSRQIAASAAVLPPVLPAGRGAGSRLRLGWVSYDFRDHPVAQLLHEMLAAFDRERFEVVLYSTGPDDGSVWRRRLQAGADRFVDLRGVSDRRAAEQIRADGIDVLVDLMGHTRGHRLGIFACRPAPVQAAYLGFPGSTGADFIDYLVGDPVVTPLALAAQYSEKLAQMPLSFQPNGRGRPLPQPMRRAAAGLPDDAFVMCAFHNPYKVLPATFDLWCSLLHELPQAVLWLRETNAQLHENARSEAARRGIAPQRLVFAPGVSYADHFSRLALADVFVDAWPYNAHTTAADALWAGVPVVTRTGGSFASRVAASVLRAVGLPELAFDSDAGYRGAVRALALDRECLASVRRHLVQGRMSLPLFDAALGAHDFGALATRMFERWRQGLPCDHLAA